MNNEVTYNSTKKTFQIDKKKFESYGSVGISANEYDRTCTVTADHAMDLKNFGPLLGFTTKKKSNNPLDINKGLKFIKISCSIINRSENVYNKTRMCLFLSPSQQFNL